MAIAQICSQVGDFDANIAKHVDFVQRAAKAGAGIICFPELSLCGYPLDGDLPNDLARPLDGELTARLAQLADDHGIVVIAGMLARAPSGVIHNAQLLTIPGGGIKAYLKTHVPTSEIGRFAPGGTLPVFALPQVTVGVQICYDTHFPEATTVQALAGAEVIFMPHASAGDETREEKRARWMRYMAARAYDNAVFAVVVNQCDPRRGFPGLAFALDPWGVMIGETEIDGEDLLVVDLLAGDLARRRAVAETFFSHFRRPELYGPVCR